MSDKYERGNFPTDDGRAWGYMLKNEDGSVAWRKLPKIPMLLSEMGPPPFDVTLPTGEVRHIMHDPSESLPPVVAGQDDPNMC